MAATARQEKEMKHKYDKIKNDPKSSPLDKLRAYVMSRGVCGIKSINRAFKRLDENGDGKLDKHEFKQALHNHGIRVDKAMEEECFDSMDRDGTGVIDLDEFIVALQPPMSQRRKDLVNQAFMKLDRDGSELVTADDLKGVYSAVKHPKYVSGEWNEEQVFGEWLNSFNGPDNFSGQVTREDFHNYYVGVSASIDGDAYFDLMMRKAWKL